MPDLAEEREVWHSTPQPVPPIFHRAGPPRRGRNAKVAADDHSDFEEPSSRKRPLSADDDARR